MIAKKLIKSCIRKKCYSSEEFANHIINKTETNNEKICNVSKLHKAIFKVTPMFIGETISLIQLINKNKELFINAESINGNTSVKIESLSDIKSKLYVNASYINHVPIDYDMYLEQGKINKAIFKNENSTIIIMGVNS